MYLDVLHKLSKHLFLHFPGRHLCIKPATGVSSGKHLLEILRQANPYNPWILEIPLCCRAILGPATLAILLHLPLGSAPPSCTGAPAFLQPTHPGFNKIALTLSLSYLHFQTFTFTILFSHFHFHIFTFTLSHFHFHIFTFTLSQKQETSRSRQLRQLDFRKLCSDVRKPGKRHWPWNEASLAQIHSYYDLGQNEYIMIYFWKFSGNLTLTY